MPNKKGFTFDQIETEMTFKMINLSDLRKNGDSSSKYYLLVKKQLENLQALWDEKIKNENSLLKFSKLNKFADLPSYDMKVS